MDAYRIISRVWVGGASLTQEERHFLEGLPCYDEGRSMLENALDACQWRDLWLVAGSPMWGEFHAWWRTKVKA